VPAPAQRLTGQLDLGVPAAGDGQRVRPVGLLHLEPWRDQHPHDDEVVADHVAVADLHPRGQLGALDVVRVVGAEADPWGGLRAPAQGVRGADGERRRQHDEVDPAEQGAGDQQQPAHEHGPAQRPGRRPLRRRLDDLRRLEVVLARRGRSQRRVHGHAHAEECRAASRRPTGTASVIRKLPS
jgi:hypothetical protein